MGSLVKASAGYSNSPEMKVHKERISYLLNGVLPDLVETMNSKVVTLSKHVNMFIGNEQVVLINKEDLLERKNTKEDIDLLIQLIETTISDLGKLSSKMGQINEDDNGPSHNFEDPLAVDSNHGSLSPIKTEFASQEVLTIPSSANSPTAQEQNLIQDNLGQLEAENNLQKKDNIKSELTDTSSNEASNVEVPQTKDDLTLHEDQKNCDPTKQSKSSKKDQKPRHECSTCQKDYSSEYALKAHKRIHTGEKPFACRMCDKRFRQLGQKQAHERTHTGEKPFQCSFCPMEFAQSSYVKAHERTHTGEKPFSCSYCDKKFSTYNIKKNHEKRHTGEKLFVCTKCDRKFSRRGSIFRHKRVCNRKLYNCNQCNQDFPSLVMFKDHKTCDPKMVQDQCMIFEVRDNPPRREHKCLTCNKECKSQAALKQHETIHTGEKPFACTMCDARFRTSTHKKKHQMIHTGEKPHQCSVCGKKFARPATLKEHMTSHTGEKRFACKYCPQKFGYPESLRRHERSHTGETPFSCNYCDQSFGKRDARKEHERIHTGEKNECKACGKQFTTNKYLQIHKALCKGQGPIKGSLSDQELRRAESSQDQPPRDEQREGHQLKKLRICKSEKQMKIHKCTTCNKHYSSNTALQRHERIHKGEKPFACTKCDARFTQLGGKKAHERTHTGEKPYECNLCDKKFTRSPYLKKHQLVHRDNSSLENIRDHTI